MDDVSYLFNLLSNLCALIKGMEKDVLKFKVLRPQMADNN